MKGRNEELEEDDDTVERAPRREARTASAAVPDDILVPEMTWTEIQDALKDRPVAIVPVGPTEAHGPHLPVSTDTVIATEMARRGAAKLLEHGVPSLIMPPVPFAVADYGADFAGTLSLPPDTVVALLRDLAVAVGKKYRAVAFANVNMEPRHLECVKKAVEEARKAGASVCYADLTKKRWADLLGDDFAKGDHGGPWETSLMMAAAPEMVRERERISLAPMETLGAALKKGAKNFTEAGSEDAYFGDPTAASAEDGEEHFEALAEALAWSIMEHLGSKV